MTTTLKPAPTKIDLTDALRAMPVGRACHLPLAGESIRLAKFSEDEYRIGVGLPTSYPNTVRMLRTMGIDGVSGEWLKNSTECELVRNGSAAYPLVRADGTVVRVTIPVDWPAKIDVAGIRHTFDRDGYLPYCGKAPVARYLDEQGRAIWWCPDKDAVYRE